MRIFALGQDSKNPAVFVLCFSNLSDRPFFGYTPKTNEWKSDGENSKDFNPDGLTVLNLLGDNVEITFENGEPRIDSGYIYFDDFRYLFLIHMKKILEWAKDTLWLSSAQIPNINVQKPLIIS